MGRTGIPTIDLTQAAVPLDEIIFDTFDGGSISLDQADLATIERLIDAIVPLDSPDYQSPGAVDWLLPDDVILGYVADDGSAWAYPVRILDRHEIVNDDLGNRPVLITYCPLCGSGVVYDRRVDGETLSFSNTSALHQNDMVMVDRESGSYWWQVAGRAIVGTRTDDRLTVLPSEMVRWVDWRDRHPDTQVLARPLGRDYSRNLFSGYSELVDSGRTPFPVDPEAFEDDRLRSGETVVVIEFGAGVWAWPVQPAMEVDQLIGDTLLRIVTDGTGGTVTRLDTGELLPTRTSMWFAIVASFPEVNVGSSAS